MLFLPRGLEQMECSSFSGNTLSDTDSTKMVLESQAKKERNNDKSLFLKMKILKYIFGKTYRMTSRINEKMSDERWSS